MDFEKLMRISIQDVEEVEQAESLYRQAEEIIEKLGYTKKEYKIASKMIMLRQRAIEDVAFILEKFVFPEDAEEIILDDKLNCMEKLVLSSDVVTWQLDFTTIEEPPYSWHGKVDITVKDVFELYKAEYLYEHHKEVIPRDFMAYYKRCYGIAGIFKIFVNGAKVRKG